MYTVAPIPESKVYSELSLLADLCTVSKNSIFLYQKTE